MRNVHRSAAIALFMGILPCAMIASCRSDRLESSEGANAPAAAIQPAAALAAPAVKTPDNYMIAFLGDQGLGENAQAVLRLIAAEGAQAVVHSGDFDYQNDPAAWEAQINDILGADFPYFASVGNHDRHVFYGEGGYQSFLRARMHRLGISWEGDLGVKSSFAFNGIFLLLTAPDIFGAGHAEYVQQKLAADHSVWRIASWHKNMKRMQIGGKSDETGWEIYEAARKGGALIATAHEHTYSRTHLMSSFQDQVVASRSDTLVLSADDPATPADEGRSFVFVSALGGRSIRDQELEGDWWASIYTSDQQASHGALFGIFNYAGKEGLAKFYFKDINGVVPDEFYVKVNAIERKDWSAK
ncbi:metallophosphoesterase [bacterium]|nr:metallophosphoesterase [bacterium]